MPRGQRGTPHRRQPALGPPDILAQYEAGLRLRGFATERDAKLGLTRRGILYDFAVASDDEAYVRFGVNLSPLDAERDELISLRFAAASATMSAVLAAEQPDRLSYNSTLAAGAEKRDKERKEPQPRPQYPDRGFPRLETNVF